MILGISGKIGSGKDTVGDIIRLLTRKVKGEGFDTTHWKIEDVIKPFGKSYNENPDSRIYTFTTRKFADKLKDIVCLLIGCKRWQLEDRDFKEKELGEEWYKWKVKLGIGVKYFSTLEEAEYFIKYEHPLKMFKSTQNEKPELIKLTPRLLLQLLGTDCGRDIIHPNIWVNALMSEYQETEDYVGGSGHTSYPTFSYPNWVVTDMRFPNEKKALEKKKGITIRVSKLYYRYLSETNEHEWRDREDYMLADIVRVKDTKYTKETSHKIWYEAFKEKLSKEHESETALDNSDFDYVIDNNGSIEELIEKVKYILIKEKVL